MGRLPRLRRRRRLPRARAHARRFRAATGRSTARRHAARRGARRAADAAGWRESWHAGGPIGAGRRRACSSEGGWYYQLAEVPDEQPRLHAGQTWDLGLFRARSRASHDAGSSCPAATRSSTRPRPGRGGRRRALQRRSTRGLFRDPATGATYLMYGRVVADPADDGIYVYRARVGPQPAAQRRLLARRRATAGRRCRHARRRSPCRATPDGSPDGTPYLAFDCGAEPARRTPRVFQDVGGRAAATARRVAFGARAARRRRPSAAARRRAAPARRRAARRRARRVPPPSAARRYARRAAAATLDAPRAPRCASSSPARAGDVRADDLRSSRATTADAGPSATLTAVPRATSGACRVAAIGHASAPAMSTLQPTTSARWPTPRTTTTSSSRSSSPASTRRRTSSACVAHGARRRCDERGHRRRGRRRRQRAPRTAAPSSPRAAGARVVHEPRRGYGSAYLAGFAAARGALHRHGRRRPHLRLRARSRASSSSSTRAPSS